MLSAKQVELVVRLPKQQSVNSCRCINSIFFSFSVKKIFSGLISTIFKNVLPSASSPQCNFICGADYYSTQLSLLRVTSGEQPWSHISPCCHWRFDFTKDVLVSRSVAASAPLSLAKHKFTAHSRRGWGFLSLWLLQCCSVLFRGGEWGLQRASSRRFKARTKRSSNENGVPRARPQQRSHSLPNSCIIEWKASLWEAEESEMNRKYRSIAGDGLQVCWQTELKAGAARVEAATGAGCDTAPPPNQVGHLFWQEIDIL